MRPLDFTIFLRLVAFTVILFGGLSVRMHGFVFITDPPAVWPDGNIPMELQLGPALDAPLQDGSMSFNEVVTNALTVCNQHINSVKFTSRQRGAAAMDGNETIVVFFSSTI
jgi:hypothetical protein